MYEITLKDLIIYIYKFFRRYIWLIVGFTILFAGLGFYMAKKQKTFYVASIYVGTGLYLYSAPIDYDIDLIASDLKTVSTQITDSEWVKENFNIDKSSFKQLKLVFKRSVYPRTYPPLKLILSAYSKDDFPKFKKGLKYYFTHKSPLLELYNAQQKIKDSIEGITMDNFLNTYNQQNIMVSLNNFYDQVFRTFKLSLPLVYFTSDFSKITVMKPNPVKKAIIWSISGIVLAIIISFIIEFFRISYVIIKSQNSE